MANAARSPERSIDDSAPPSRERRTRLDLDLTPSRPDRATAQVADIDLRESLRFSKAVGRGRPGHRLTRAVLDDLRNAMAELSGELHASQVHRRCRNRAPSGLATWVRRALRQAIQTIRSKVT